MSVYNGFPESGQLACDVLECPVDAGKEQLRQDCAACAGRAALNGALPNGAEASGGLFPVVVTPEETDDAA